MAKAVRHQSGRTSSRLDEVQRQSAGYARLDFEDEFLAHADGEDHRRCKFLLRGDEADRGRDVFRAADRNGWRPSGQASPSRTRSPARRSAHRRCPAAGSTPPGVIAGAYSPRRKKIKCPGRTCAGATSRSESRWSRAGGWGRYLLLRRVDLRDEGVGSLIGRLCLIECLFRRRAAGAGGPCCPRGRFLACEVEASIAPDPSDLRPARSVLWPDRARRPDWCR